MRGKEVSVPCLLICLTWSLSLISACLKSTKKRYLEVGFITPGRGAPGPSHGHHNHIPGHLSESQPPATAQSPGAAPISSPWEGASLATGPQCLLPALASVPLLLCQQQSCSSPSVPTHLILPDCSPQAFPWSYPQACPTLAQAYIPRGHCFLRLNLRPKVFPQPFSGAGQGHRSFWIGGPHFPEEETSRVKRTGEQMKLRLRT